MKNVASHNGIGSACLNVTESIFITFNHPITWIYMLAGTDIPHYKNTI